MTGTGRRIGWALRDAVSTIAFHLLMRHDSPRKVTLLYHSVEDLDPGNDPLKINITPARLDLHLKSLIPLRNRVHITFDDGYRNNLTAALPILRRHGFKAAFFIPTDFIDKKIGMEAFGWEHESVRPLSWSGVRQLAAAGMTIGSHGRSHVNLACLDARDLCEEMEGSRRRIYEMTSRQVSDFAYPFGHRGAFNRGTRLAAKKAGYQRAYVNLMGANPKGRANPYELRRIRVYHDDSPEKLRMKIFGAYDWVDLVASAVSFGKRRTTLPFPRPNTGQNVPNSRSLADGSQSKKGKQP